MLRILLNFLLISNIYSQELPPKQAYEFDVKQIHSGHSLTDPLFHPWPGQYRYLMTEHLSGPWDKLGKSTIPGSPMFWRWDNEQDLEPSARHDIEDWELLVITEGVPIPEDWENPGSIQPAKEYFSRYVNNAWENVNGGSGAPTLLWTTWTNIDDSDGPWRELLDDYESKWEEMMDYANENLPSGANHVYLIPGHRMMARLYDDIEEGIVPGINSIDEFFSDNIHVNDLGGYAVAMIHYACIFNKSPVGLPYILFNSNDAPNKLIPSEELAFYLQNMIWDVVTNYSRTGVIDETTEIENIDENLIIYPNPANNFIYVKSKKEGSHEFQLRDLNGRILITSKNKRINISTLESGIYFVFSDDNISKIIVELVFNKALLLAQ